MSQFILLTLMCVAANEERLDGWVKARTPNTPAGRRVSRAPKRARRRPADDTWGEQSRNPALLQRPLVT